MDSGHLSDYEKFGDEELVRLSGSNKTALSALLFRYKSTAEQMAVSLAPAKSEHTVNDLVQEGLIALLSAVNSYRPDRGAGFKTYACVCIRHRMLSYIMKDNRSAPTDTLSANELDEYMTAKEEDIPENVVIAKVSDEELFCKIADELSGLEWNVLQLFLAGLSYRQIADELAISEKSVNNTMQRVRKKLRAIFK